MKFSPAKSSIFKILGKVLAYDTGGAIKEVTTGAMKVEIVASLFSNNRSVICDSVASNSVFVNDTKYH